MEYQSEINPSEEMLNSAFIDPKDIQFSFSQENWLDQEYDLENCYLDPTNDFSLERSIIRCDVSYNHNIHFAYSPQAYASNKSPIQLKHDSVMDDQEDFTLPDSCLLFTTSDNLESDFDQLTTVSDICDDDFQPEVAGHKNNTQITADSGLADSKDKLSLDRNESIMVSCKTMYNYLMKPITSKLVKKFGKQKCDKPVERPILRLKQNLIKQKIVQAPVQLYANTNSRQNKQHETPKAKRSISNRPNQFFQTQAQLDSSPLMTDNVMDNNFVKCGEFVTYFV